MTVNGFCLTVFNPKHNIGALLFIVSSTSWGQHSATCFEFVQLSIILLHLLNLTMLFQFLMNNQQLCIHFVFSFNSPFHVYPQSCKRSLLLSVNYVASYVYHFTHFFINHKLHHNFASKLPFIKWYWWNFFFFLLQHSTLKCRIVTFDLWFLDTPED